MDWQSTLSFNLNKSDGNKLSEALQGYMFFEEIWPQLLDFYHQHNYVDFDLVMLIFEQSLRSNDKFCQFARSHFTHIIIDEFQDTNFIQLRSLKHLRGDKTKQVICVGDDFQSLYSWRAADPQVFVHFAKWGKCHTLALTTNYRSGSAIIDHLNQNTNALQQYKLPDVNIPDTIKCGRPDIQAEVHRAKDFQEAIDKLHKLGCKNDEIAILSYTNRTARNVKKFYRQQAHLNSLDLDLFPGLKRFISALSLIVSDSVNLPACWHLRDCPADHFTQLWRTFKRDPQLKEFQELFGSLGKSIFSVSKKWSSEKPSTKLLLASFKILASKDKVILKDKGLCRILCYVLGKSYSFKLDPQRCLAEMTSRDFTSDGKVDGKITVSTIHQFKGLQRRAIVLIKDFETDSREKLNLLYVGLSRPEQFLIIVEK